MRFICCYLALLCLYVTDNGQAHVHFKELTGTVVTDSGRPLQNALVHMVHCGNTAVTNRTGTFHLVYPLCSDTMIIFFNGRELHRLMVKARTSTVIIRIPAKRVPVKKRRD